MLTFLGILALIWIIITIIGFVVEGILWLAIIGIVAFLSTVIFGWLKGRATRRQRG